MKRIISILLVVILSLSSISFVFAESGLSNFSAVRAYVDGQFSDVKNSDWFAPYVKQAYNLNLMSGNSTTTFNPNGNVTLAETITVAARLHSIYYGIDIPTATTGKWYQPFVDYALSYKIITKPYSDYNAQATRAEYATILVNSLGEDAFAVLSSIDDDAIPDVKVSATFGGAVYKLYRAGIISGSDTKGTFNPTSNIKRSEVATILAKMVDPSLRKAITLYKSVNLGNGASYRISDSDLQYYKNSIDNIEYYAYVEITNTGSKNLYLKSAAFDLEDDSHHLLQTENWISNCPDVIAPGEKGYFYNSLGSNLIDDGVSVENGLNLAYNVTIQEAKSSPVNYIVTDTALRKGLLDSPTVTGRVTNNTAEDDSLVYVQVIYYDAAGKVLAITGTNIMDLPAGATVSFECSGVYMNDNANMDTIANYKVIAQKAFYQY